jgi:hypothetical protein
MILNILTEIENLNEKYKLNNANGIENINSLNYIFIMGYVPILLSAPHAVKQGRNGVQKAEDANTGGIVEYICNTSNCYGIIRNHNNLDDPNKDNFGLGLAYKQKILSAIREYDIKLVLDIHGCSNSHDFDFCIGTNSGRNLNGQDNILEILNVGLSSIGKTVIDEYFKASLDGNISKYVSHNSSVPSIQLEISNKFRRDNKYLEQLLLVLQTSINNINKRCLSNEKDLER